MYGVKNMVRVDIGVKNGMVFVNEVQLWYGAGLFFHLDVTGKMKRIHAGWFRKMLTESMISI